MDPKSIPERWREWWDERCALLEYEAGYPRATAEQMALAMLRTYLATLQKRRAA